MDRVEPRHASAFDEQAHQFDGRAGLPSGVPGRIADAIVAIASLGPGARALDIGAGTGEVGRELLGRGVLCVALDESKAMLEIFREKAVAAGLTPELVARDAGLSSPVGDGSMHLVFGSRSLHWLPVEHVCREAFRVAAPEGCAVLVGRVERDAAGPRARIRRKMRELLRAAGFVGRDGGETAREIVERCAARGATRIVPRVAATWSTRRTPRTVLDDWRNKSGLGGAEVPTNVKEQVLASTAAWAAETFGDIDVSIESEECYTLAGVALSNRFDR